MIIVLKDADFSGKNIGKVEIDRQLNAYTIAAIEASGNENLTETQKFALDDLFLALGVDGSNNVLAKIRKLYLPMIASEVGNALINYATNDFTKDFTPNSANWELRNLGITQKASGQSFTGTLSNPLLANNFTQMWLRTENMVSDVSDTCYSLVLRGKTDTSKFLGMTENSQSSNKVISWSGYGYEMEHSGTVVSKGNEQRTVAGLTVRSAQDVYIQVYHSVSPISTLPITTDMEGESLQTLYVLGLSDQKAPKPFGFMLLGEALTDAQFQEIRGKVNALYVALGGQIS